MSETIQAQPTEKVVFEFQHTDATGAPIIDPRTGKQAFTNLTGTDYKEIAEKLKDSYLNVARAYDRTRQLKAVPKEPEPTKKELTAEEQRQATIDLQDPIKAPAAIRKLGGIDDLEAREEAARQATFKAQEYGAQCQFVLRHTQDYFQCTANRELLMKYISDNDLDSRNAENYEIAYNAVLPLLAQRPQPTPQPIIEPEPAPARKPNGGIEPGSLSGKRPDVRAKKPDVTREMIDKMRQTKDGRAEYGRRLRTEPGFREKVNAAYAAQT